VTAEAVRIEAHVPSPGPAEHAVPHAAGLDGLRGLAVLAVLAYHLDLPWAGGGFLGVEVFFTLSGFLITQLVAAELRRSGRLDVGAFARARARRLLPALLVCVAGTVVAYRLLRPAEVPALRWDALASLGYLQNWRLAFGGMPYAASFGPPSPLLHAWSLAVEAQLYLVWPLLFVTTLALLTRSTAVVVTLLLAWLSAVAMAHLYSPDGGGLAYYVTPARASGFLVGAALALAFRPEAWTRRAPRPVDAAGDALGLAALATLLVGFATVSEFDAGLYENAGLLRAGLVTAVLVVAAIRGGLVGALLATRPLAAVGRRSYGLYLYHWPIFVLGRDLPLRAVTCLAVTAAVTEVSYRLLEIPVRRGGLRTVVRRLRLPSPVSPTALLATGTALAVAVVVGTSPVAGIVPAAPPDAATDLAAGVAEDAAAPQDAEAAAPPSTALRSHNAEPPGSPTAPRRQNADPPDPAPPAGAATTATTGSSLVVGDSIALGSTGALRAALGADTTVDARVGRQFAACPAIVGRWARSHDGPIVVALGANGTIGRRDLDAVVAAGGARRVVLVGVAVARRWTDGNNAVLRAAAAGHPQVAFVDWAAIVASHPGVLGPDGVHPGPRGRTLLAGAVADAVRG
jgi:peptidoglycan/LPS O-acetylase OafA/YrhL